MAERIQANERSVEFRQLKSYLQRLVRDTFGDDNQTVSVISTRDGVQVLFTHHHAPHDSGPDDIVRHVYDTICYAGIFPMDIINAGNWNTPPSFFLRGDINELLDIAKRQDPQRFADSQSNDRHP